MTEEQKRIRLKIMKCLELSKSDNEHEAAAALSRAQALMEAHGVSEFDVQHADIQEQAARAGAMKKPARWEMGLAARVAHAFDCAVVLAQGYPAGQWRFIGATPSAEIARFAFEQLHRQIKKARADYIKSALKRCKPSTRTSRADLYCEGWVTAATKLVLDFAGNVDQQARNQAYLEARHGDLATCHGRDRNAGRKLDLQDCDAIMAGTAEGRKAQLRHGVGGANERRAIG